jgi:dihydroflavonol-4-reductase
VKIFLTGASGFIGLNIVKALMDEEHEVVAYIRESSNVKYLNDFPVGLTRGDLTDLTALAAAMKNCEAVIHCAGNTSCEWRDYADLKTANVVSTRNIIEAALVNGIKRIVYTSTTSTIGAPPDGSRPGGEEEIINGFRAKSPYAVTKKAAEKELVAAQDKGIEPVILNPAEVLGPFDHNMQWGRIILAIASGNLPFMPPGGGSFCAAADVARAHVSAIENGHKGEKYILAGHDVTFSELFDIIGGVVGRKPVPLSRAPYGYLRLRARTSEILSPVTGTKPAVDSYRLRVFGKKYYFSSKKAKSHLGYQSRSLTEMVNESFDWYRENGFIEAGASLT